MTVVQLVAVSVTAAAIGFVVVYGLVTLAIRHHDEVDRLARPGLDVYGPPCRRCGHRDPHLTPCTGPQIPTQTARHRAMTRRTR